MKALADNKRATFDYTLIDKYEAGLVLSGQEVKSIKTGHLSLKGSFVTIKAFELYLTNAFIPPYPFAGQLKNYDPSRSRKLLVKKSEIKRLLGKVHAEGLTLVPIRVYTRKRLIKLEFALARGKKKFDKRADIAKKEASRRIARNLKTSRNF
ncbi:MAG: SsrA-binding protein SmpB [Candidatus Moranbacteria bacterium]|jgi:SsrA-binding protein|nr:SsrA-binding protein SmpB [Candidatus Moranbacteria bacterium]